MLYPYGVIVINNRLNTCFMKLKCFSLCFVALLCTQISFAKIWRVNNNGGGGGDFTNAQAAHDGGTLAGDTIHLEPSPNSYGGLSTSKRLVWISCGSFLGIHPGEQFTQTPGKIISLIVNVGAENSIFNLYIDGAVTIAASNIRIERCFITGGFQTGAIPNNLVLINSYLKGYVVFYTGTNHFVSNNIFESYVRVDAVSSAIIQNNVVNGVDTYSDAVINNATVQNNIFNKSTGPLSFVNCTVQYNMSGSGGVLPAGNFNQNNIAMANVFVNNSGNTDAAFGLKVGSPAIGSGAMGADMGAYGGTTPFKIALQPAIPAITKIVAPFVPAGNTMNVTFSTKSNN